MPTLSLVSLHWQEWFLLARAFLVIAGGFLVHLSLGTLYTMGNMAPYIVSYIRNQSHPSNLKQETTAWLSAAAVVGQGGAMLVGGLIMKKIGPRWTTLIGGWLMSLGVGLSYFAIKLSFWFLLVTYGLVFGVGIGIAYIGPLSSVMSWLPRWKGFANGIVVAGFGLGALIFNAVQTAFVNPRNVGTVKNENGEEYFIDPELLGRVPVVFVILGGTYAVMQLVGSLLLTGPPEDYDISTRKSNFETSKVHSNYNSSMVEDEMSPNINSPSFDSSTGSGKVRLINNDTPVATYSGSESIYRPNDGLEAPINECSEKSTDDLNPKQMLKKPKFYALWYMFLANGLAVTFVAPLYKFIGQQSINDDHFLASVGSAASAFNCLGRIIWGVVADASSFNSTLVVLSAILTIFSLTIDVTTEGGKEMFFIWICLIFFCMGGNYSLFPAVTGRTFGLRYVSVNYGIMFTSQLVAGLVGALLSTTLKSLIGYDGLLFLGSAFSFSTLLLAIFYRIQ